MAEEVGAAFVSLIPSARGFSRLARREIKQALAGDALTVPIQPEIDQAAVTRMLGQTARVKATVEVDRSQVQAALMAVRERVTVNGTVPAAGMIRETRSAIRETEATRPKVHVGVDVDRPGILGRLLSGGDDSGRAAGARLGSGLLSGLTGSLQGGGLVVGAAVLAAVIAPAAVAAVTLAGAGLGAIFAGAFILASNPVLQQAWAGFLGTVGPILQQAAQPLVRPLVEGLDIIADAFQTIGPQLRAMFAGIAPVIPTLAAGVAGFIEAFTPGLVDAVIASGPVLEQIAFALPDLGAALSSFLSDMAVVAPQAARFIGMVIRGLSDIIQALGSIVRVGAEVFTPILGALSLLWGALKIGWAILTGDFGRIKAYLEVAVGALLRLFRGFWTGLVGGAQAAAGALLRLFHGLPGRIRSAVGSLGGLLYQAGRNVVQGLIGGIRSMFGSLGTVASNMAGVIRNYLPFSPAKEGPLSGSGNPFVSGQAIAEMLAAGMTSRQPAVASAAAGLAGAVSGGGRGAAAAGTPGGLSIRWADGTTGDRLLDALSEMIRVDWAGDPDYALRRGRRGVAR